jgi:hypothetical protein
MIAYYDTVHDSREGIILRFSPTFSAVLYTFFEENVIENCWPKSQ